MSRKLKRVNVRTTIVFDYFIDSSFYKTEDGETFSDEKLMRLEAEQLMNDRIDLMEVVGGEKIVSVTVKPQPKPKPKRSRKKS